MDNRNYGQLLGLALAWIHVCNLWEILVMNYKTHCQRRMHRDDRMNSQLEKNQDRINGHESRENVCILKEMHSSGKVCVRVVRCVEAAGKAGNKHDVTDPERPQNSSFERTAEYPALSLACDDILPRWSNRIVRCMGLAIVCDVDKKSDHSLTLESIHSNEENFSMDLR